MLNSIIKNHLNTNKRLVIPNFGTFVKKENNTDIVFVELLKKDDGVLNSLVMSNYSVESAKAGEIVSNFVNSIKQDISKNGCYFIPGMGILRATPNGAYTFNSGNQAKQKPENEQPVVNATSPKTETKTIEKPQPQRVVIEKKEIAEPVAVAQKQEEQPTQVTQTPPEPINVSGLNYRKPIKPTEDGSHPRRTDLIMIIAMVAAGIAILAMLYGLFFSAPNTIELTPHLEVAPQDSTEQVVNN